MRRRWVLVAAPFALTGCLGAAPDASGPRTPPTPPEGGPPVTPEPDLYLRTFDVEEGESGEIRVVGTVGNRSDARRTGTVEATVSAPGETATRSTEVTVAAGGDATFEIPFDVAYEAFAERGSVNVTVTG